MKPSSPRRRVPRIRPLSTQGSPRHRRTSLLPDALWSRLEDAFPVSLRKGLQEPPARATAERLLEMLRRGTTWSWSAPGDPDQATSYELWQRWLTDGTWMRFWKAYAEELTPRARREWRSSLARTGERLLAGGNADADTVRLRAWWLVSAAVLDTTGRPAAGLAAAG